LFVLVERRPQTHMQFKPESLKRVSWRKNNLKSLISSIYRTCGHPADLDLVACESTSFTCVPRHLFVH